MFSKVTGSSITLHEFMNIISHWNKKISEEQVAFLNPILPLLNKDEIKNKMLKHMIQEHSFKFRKKRLKTFPY